MSRTNLKYYPILTAFSILLVLCAGLKLFVTPAAADEAGLTAASQDKVSALLTIVENPEDSPEVRLESLGFLTTMDFSIDRISPVLFDVLKNTEDSVSVRLKSLDTLCGIGMDMRETVTEDSNIDRALSQLLQEGKTVQEIDQLSSAAQLFAVPYLADTLLDTQDEKCLIHLRAAAAINRIGMDRVEESLESAQLESVRNTLNDLEKLKREIADKRYRFRRGSATRVPRHYDVLDSTKVMSDHALNWQGGLLTADGYQYLVFYDGDQQLTAAARNLDSSEWDIERFPDRFDRARSGESLAVDSKGILHYTGNMHDQPLVYFRTREPGDISTFERIEGMVGREENRMAYPNFFTCVEGNLHFSYRHGRSGEGRQIVNVWDAEEQNWERLGVFFDGLGREAAQDIPRLGPDRRWHLATAWRVSPDMNDNRRVTHAWSEDAENWEAVCGKEVELPITPDTEGVVVDPTGVQQGLQGPSLGFDAEKRPILTISKYDEEGINQHYNIRLEEDEWVTYQTSDWEWRWHFGGWGIQTFKIRLFPVILSENDRLLQDYLHWKVDPDGWEKRRQYPSNRSMRWLLDPDTLKPLLNVKLPQREELWPKEMFPADPEQEVHFLEDLGDSGQEGVKYVVRYTTSGEPEMKVFKLKGLKY